MRTYFDPGFWRRRRVRLIRQTETAECGLACLAMVANYYGLEVDLATLRRRFAPSARGAALKSLIEAADQLGFLSRPLRVPLEEVPDLHMPSMLHWDMNHYVVLERVKGNNALIHNPGARTKWYSFPELSKHFTGVALELRPAEDFEPAARSERLKLHQLWRSMTGLKRALVQTLVLTIVMQAFVLASPYYMQIAIDRVLPARDSDLLTILALGFGLFTLINAAASLLRAFVLLSAGTSLSFGVTTNVARRLFRLPISWFEKRHVGDILSRFQSIMPIQQALTQGAIAALIDGVLAILILILMTIYSPALTALSLGAFLLYGLVRLASFSAQREVQEEALDNRAREQTMLMESIRGIVTLRLFNGEITRHSHWQNTLANAVNAEIRVSRISAWQTTANALILGLEMVLSIWLAIGLVIGGGFSVGMIFAYMTYKTQFLIRVTSLVDQGFAFRMLGLYLERLSDIAMADPDVSFTQARAAAVNLRGRIELRDISFRYSPSDPLVLDGLNLVVEPGEHVAITGRSGGGKTTLVKVILGLLEPEKGEVLVDGVPLARFGYKNFHDQVAAVLQDDNLFGGSLAHNIALFDDSPDMDRVIQAAIAAAIHDDIARMPMGYETLVGDMGSFLSGGQKQRILLARALYRQPRLLIMDEGTAYLDATTEAAVNKAISALGITRIIIAHRSETISAADRRLITSAGKLVDMDI